jgi:N-[(2S)-2-amino-2-carboxyethyl]-L-glutamate dehydrogenase
VKAITHDNEILVLRSGDISSLLTGKENELIETVRTAYVAHSASLSSLPHSVFLTFPNDTRNRIIALPAYLGDGVNVAGLKWISSFPGNLSSGMDRASAVVILNSMETGRPDAILEGSIISAKRTAASAALAAKHLHDNSMGTEFGIIGCGFINFEVLRFISAVFPGIEEIVVYDIDPMRANHFKRKCYETFNGLEVRTANVMEDVLQACSIVSFGTTVTIPYVGDISRCRSRATILHISLRDLSPGVILSCDNVVDDIDHVCRAQTSIHLAEQLVGNRDFINCTLGSVLSGIGERRREGDRVTVFSPFGLGVLDIAVANLVRVMALEAGRGTLIESFLPDSWGNQTIA